MSICDNRVCVCVCTKFCSSNSGSSESNKKLVCTCISPKNDKGEVNSKGKISISNSSTMVDARTDEVSNTNEDPYVIQVISLDGEDVVPIEDEIFNIYLPSRVVEGEMNSGEDSSYNIFANTNLKGEYKVSCAFLNVKINDKIRAHTLLDTGANVSAFSYDFYRKYKDVFGELLPLPSDKKFKCSAVNNSRLLPVGKIKFSMRLGTRKYNYEVYVIDQLRFDFIFGTDLIFYVRGAVDIYYRKFFFGNPRQSVDIDIGVDEDIVSSLLAMDFVSFMSASNISIPANSAQHVFVTPNIPLIQDVRYYIVGDDTADRWVCPGEYVHHEEDTPATVPKVSVTMPCSYLPCHDHTATKDTVQDSILRSTLGTYTSEAQKDPLLGQNIGTPTATNAFKKSPLQGSIRDNNFADKSPLPNGNIRDNSKKATDGLPYIRMGHTGLVVDSSGGGLSSSSTISSRIRSRSNITNIITNSSMEGGDSHTSTGSNSHGIYLRVCNFSTQPLRIACGQRIALGIQSNFSDEPVVGSLDLGNWSDDHMDNANTEAFSISNLISSIMTSEPDSKATSSIKDDFFFDLNLGDKTDISESQKHRLVAVLKEKILAFSKDDEDLGLTHLVQLVLDTGDAPPQAQGPYKCAQEQDQWLEEKIRVWLDKQVIQPSLGEWAAPCSLIRKKGGGYRLVIDYRKLNSVLKPIGMHWPLTLIDSCLDSMNGSMYFSALDINQAFEQVPVEPSSVPKTGFVCKYGHFEFLRAPQGVKNMPSTFTKLTDLMLQGLKWKVVNVFADDILIFSQNFDDHLRDISLVLDRIISAGLKLKLRKCVWAQYEVEYLGHLINRTGILPAPSKIDTVLNYPIPRTPKKVHSFVSLCSYYRRFIKAFSTISAPLNNLSNSKGKFKWTKECQDTFLLLKNILTTAPILIYPNFNEPFFLSTDASNVGLGAILFQYDKERFERVVSYASRTLNGAERNYSTTHKEGLGVVWAIKKFHTYLYGRKFTVITDHKPLIHLFSIKDPTGRLYRWSMKLQEYDFQLVYKPGRTHTNVDVLSRIPEEVINSAIVGLDVDDHISLQTLTNFPHTDPLISAIIAQDPAFVDSYLDEYAPDWSFSLDLLLAQKEDPELSIIINSIVEGRDIYPNYYLHPSTKLLMHIYHPTDSRQHRHSFRQIVVPKCFHLHVLRAYHDHPLSGHMDYSRTYAKILTKYYWPSLRSDCDNYVKSCLTCSTGKTPRRTRTIPQGIHPPVWAPFQRLSMDFLSLSETERGNTHVLVVICAFSRWVEIFPTKDEQAETVARTLYDNIITRFGCPKTLLSDHGPSFTAAVIKELCIILGIKKLFTTPYHPQSNGLVERSNSTILSTLRSYVDDFGKDWDLHLPSVRFAINTISNTTTNETPYYIVFGKDAPLPIDLTFLHYNESNISDLTSYSQEIIRRLRQAYHTVTSSYEKTLQKNKTHKDKHANKVLSFSVSQKVWLYVPINKDGYNRKLYHPWHGPYRVIEKFSDTTYGILPCDGSTTVILKVHVSRLKLYIERTINIPDLPPHNRLAEDPSLPLSGVIPPLPTRAERIIFESPEVSVRAPTEQELAYVRKRYRDPDDKKVFEVTSCVYDKEYKEIVYHIVLLHAHRNGSYSRTSKSYRSGLLETQYYCDNYPIN